MTFGDNLTDKQIIDFIEEIDEGEHITVTRWEADFIDSILRQKVLTKKQRITCLGMIETYRDRL